MQIVLDVAPACKLSQANKSTPQVVLKARPDELRPAESEANESEAR